MDSVARFLRYPANIWLIVLRQPTRSEPKPLLSLHHGRGAVSESYQSHGIAHVTLTSSTARPSAWAWPQSQSHPKLTGGSRTEPLKVARKQGGFADIAKAKQASGQPL